MPSIDPPLVGRLARRQPPCGDQHTRCQHQPEQRKRQKHLPAEPHQLVIAEPREGRTYPQETEQHEGDFQREPDWARDPGEGCDAKRSEPAAEEEHTSELQSRLHLVCHLLLEQKKKFSVASDRIRDNSKKLAIILSEANN